MTQHHAELAGLIEALHSSNIEQRAKAVWALRDYTKQTLPYLQDALKDKEPLIREAAAAALGAARCREGIWSLLEVLGDRDYSVAAMAAKALGALGEPAAVPGLVQALKNASPEVRKSAARALSLIGDPGAIPHVQQAARHDIDDVREVAREALLRLRYGKGGPVFEPEVIDFTVIVKREKRATQWVRYVVAALLLIAALPTGIAMLTLFEDADVMLAGFAGAVPAETTFTPVLAALAEYEIDQRMYPASAETDYFFLALSPDGGYVAVGTSQIDIWHIDTAQILYSIQPPDAEPIYSLAFSPDGSLLAAGSADSVYLFDAANGQLEETLGGQIGEVQAVAFNASGQRLYGATKDVVVWQVGTGDVVQVYSAEDYIGNIISLTTDPTQNRFATGMRLPAEHRIWLWDGESGNILFRFAADGPTSPAGVNNPVEAIAYSPDGQYIAAAPGYGTIPTDNQPRPITVWDTGRGVEALRIEGHTNAVTALTYLHDGQILASTSYDETIKLWNAQTGDLLETLSPGGRIYDMAASEDDSTLVTLTDDSIVVWQAVSNVQE